MKKLIFVFIMVIAIAMIAGYKQSAQNEMAEKNVNPATPGDFKGINKPDADESKANPESFTPKKAPESRPGILIILSNDKGRASRSTSLWWSYQGINTRQTGC